MRLALTFPQLGRRAFASGAACMIAACRRGPATTVPDAREGDGASDDAGHHAVYDASGEPSTLAAFADGCIDADVVGFGELHEHVVASRLELELLEALLGQPRPVALAMEFFETDHQPAIDAYFAGEIDEATFRERSARNEAYATSHRPLVELCKSKGAKVVAGNPPRRLVTAYRKSGKDYDSWRATLSEDERALVPEHSVPPHDEHERRFMTLMGPKRGPAFFKSMALWNDAMAEAIVRTRIADPQVRVLLVVGAFHVAGKLGVVTAVHEREPQASVRVLTMRNGGAAWRESDRGEGDLVVCVT